MIEPTMQSQQPQQPPQVAPPTSASAPLPTPDIQHTNTTKHTQHCLLYTSPSPRDRTRSRMPSSA